MSEEKKMINQLDENTWDVLGDMPVDDLWQEILGKDNEETDEYVTISGYLMAKMNKIPALNESYTDDCFKYTVKRLKKKKIANGMKICRQVNSSISSKTNLWKK